MFGRKRINKSDAMLTYFIIISLIIIFGTLAQSNMNNDGLKGKVSYNKLGNLYIGICTFILIFVSAFRYKMGTDYGNYMRAYPRYCKEWFSYVKEFEEPGIGILIKLASFIYDDYLSMFVICALVTVTLYMNTIKKCSQSFLYSVLIFIFIGSWHGSFNAMRQYLAAGILFAGHRYLYDRKLIRYLIVVFLATAFHKTAIIMLPIYFIVGRELNTRNIILSVIMVVVIRYGYDFLFSTMSFLKGSDQTQYSYMRQEVNVFRILVSLAPVALILLIRKTSAFFDYDTQFYCMLLIVNCCLLFATKDSAYLARGAVYTETYVSLALPRMAAGLEKKTRSYFTFFVLLLYSFNWIYELYARNLVPFVWVFER